MRSLYCCRHADAAMIAVDATAHVLHYQIIDVHTVKTVHLYLDLTLKTLLESLNVIICADAVQIVVTELSKKDYGQLIFSLFNTMAI